MTGRAVLCRKPVGEEGIVLVSPKNPAPMGLFKADENDIIIINTISANLCMPGAF